MKLSVLPSCLSIVGELTRLHFSGNTTKRLNKWLESNLKCKDTITVEWLPTGLFDSHSHFALLFRDVCLDVGIHGDTLRVTQTSEHGGYRTVTFGSEDELECFLKVEMRRALAK